MNEMRPGRRNRLTKKGQGGRTELQRLVGNRVKRARIKAGLTQQQVADATGTVRSAVAMVETGWATSLVTLERIAGVVGVRLVDLIPRRRPPAAARHVGGAK